MPEKPPSHLSTLCNTDKGATCPVEGVSQKEIRLSEPGEVSFEAL